MEVDIPKSASKAKKAKTLKKPHAPKKASSKVRLSLEKKKMPLKKQAVSRTVGKAKKGTVSEQVYERIRQKLLKQKKAILTEAGVAMNSLPEQTVFPDLGDQASVESDRAFMLRLRSREQKLLKKVEDALERIEKGIFGICEVCGRHIELKRIEARPVTTMCIDCKTEQEEEEKLQGV